MVCLAYRVDDRPLILMALDVADLDVHRSTIALVSLPEAGNPEKTEVSYRDGRCALSIRSGHDRIERTPTSAHQVRPTPGH
jgi:hypothetical protein